MRVKMSRICRGAYVRLPQWWLGRDLVEVVVLIILMTYYFIAVMTAVVFQFWTRRATLVPRLVVMIMLSASCWMLIPLPRIIALALMVLLESYVGLQDRLLPLLWECFIWQRIENSCTETKWYLSLNQLRGKEYSSFLQNQTHWGTTFLHSCGSHQWTCSISVP